MKIKKLLTSILMSFVIISITYFLYTEFTKKKNITHKNKISICCSSSFNSKPNKIIVYYFYGNRRCRTCFKIENFTKEAINKYYGNLIKNETLQWKPVNVEKTKNKHFIKDYKLVSKSVIITKYKNGKIQKWKNLNQVWNLYNNKEKFNSYIQEEIKSLKETS